MGAEDVLGLAVHALATGDDGPVRPSTGLYVARVYGVRDPALCDSGRDAEAKYLLTTLEAAVAAVADLGASEEATSTTEPETDVNDEVEIIEISIGNESLKGWEDLSAAWAADSDAVLLLKLALVSAVASAGVKYGSLLVDFPFEPNLWVAYSIIFVPTLLNCAKWKQLSDEGAAL